MLQVIWAPDRAMLLTEPGQYGRNFLIRMKEKYYVSTWKRMAMRYKHLQPLTTTGGYLMTILIIQCWVNRAPFGILVKEITRVLCTIQHLIFYMALLMEPTAMMKSISMKGEKITDIH